MLRKIRHGVTGFFAKILIVIIVISFAFWGVQDMVTKSSPGTVAQVGGEEVSVAEFQRSIRDIRNSLGDQYSPELLRSLNLYQIKLQSLISSKLLVQEARRLGITISDEAVVRYISKDKSFYNPNGNFDRGLFTQIIRQQGYTESQYIEALRNQLAARIIVTALTEEPAYPKSLLDLLYQARNEKRELLLIHLTPAIASDIVQANETDLKSFFDKHREQYGAPEYRTIRYITVDPQKVMDGLTISREDVMEAYQQRAGELVRPERRKVEQLLYDKKELADKAYEMLMAGAKPDDVAKSVPPVNAKSVSLGWKAHGELPTGEKEVFALNRGEFTKPLESPFGWQVYVVTDVGESRALPFEEVRESLEKEIRQNRAEEEVQRQVERLEDAISAGSTLEQISEALSSEIMTSEPVTQSGVTPDNREAFDATRYSNVLKAAFEMKEGESSDLITESDGTFTVLQVQAITPARERTFDEVRGQVAQDWKADNSRTAFLTRADALAKELIEGKEPNLAAMPGVRVEHGTLSRDGAFQGPGSQPSINIPTLIVEQLYGLEAGQPFSRAFPLGEEYAIARLVKVVPADDPKTDPEAKKDYNALKRSLAQDYRDEILHQYFTALRQQYPVSVNANILQALIKE